MNFRHFKWPLLKARNNLFNLEDLEGSQNSIVNQKQYNLVYTKSMRSTSSKFVSLHFFALASRYLR